MSVVIQEEATGCGIASAANILGLSYAEAKATANSMGIYASDEALFSDTAYMRRLLDAYGVKTSADETLFAGWNALPNTALLSIKHHYENGKPFWHWVVFKRTSAGEVLLDSAAYLDNNEITDFSAIKPTWYISVSA
ncbi:hypothetical protein [Amphritea japonica]|uniref:Peptidase C39 domain-containing protein n=1 Tax=Amphritea japonica ATCC BAA-1530 TaxID=1278309 RepID=A0A7R6PKR8_9GAMM|nr:hypothetical protein [Amphritea japonica]BBB26150.1 conserved hypothetical protein [Amphritea japonica ATCC BAA-1530]